ncbi:GNAT family N-acetyltransferase, partial [Klebsiella oxytoca]
MVYFSKGQLTIRNMEPGDARAITEAEIEQGWDASVEKYLKRL